VEYYEVTGRTIEELISKNKNELISNGCGLRKALGFVSEFNFGNKVIKQEGNIWVKISYEQTYRLH